VCVCGEEDAGCTPIPAPADWLNACDRPLPLPNPCSRLPNEVFANDDEALPAALPAASLLAEFFRCRWWMDGEGVCAITSGSAPVDVFSRSTPGLAVELLLAV
jgi:hypothetical protein